MSRTSKRYAVYPAKKAVEVLGESIPALNQAVECWAALLSRATARNADTFFNYRAFWDPFVQDGFEEWCLLAELLKELEIEPEFPNPCELLVTALEDADLLEKLGEKHFHSHLDDVDHSKSIKSFVEKLNNKLRGLHYVDTWALITAVQWYWRHSEKIDFHKDPWWTLAFRRRPLVSEKEQSQPQKRTAGAMARAEKRYAIYPAPRAIEVVGESLPALNQAIECWAALVARATADNAKTFQQPDEDGDNELFGEWSMLAGVLKGMRFEAEFMNPSGLIASTVEDAHRLESIGNDCLPFRFDGKASSVFKNRQPEIDEHVRKLVEKLRNPNFDYSHAWAVIVAVRWYWEHADDIDAMRDRWWTLHFRRPGKKNVLGSECESPGAKASEEDVEKKLKKTDLLNPLPRKVRLKKEDSDHPKDKRHGKSRKK